jgi:hypothetical protein
VDVALWRGGGEVYQTVEAPAGYNKSMQRERGREIKQSGRERLERKKKVCPSVSSRSYPFRNTLPVTAASGLDDAQAGCPYSGVRRPIRRSV